MKEGPLAQKHTASEMEVLASKTTVFDSVDKNIEGAPVLSEEIPILTQKQFEEVLNISLPHIEGALLKMDYQNIHAYEDASQMSVEERLDTSLPPFPGLVEYTALREGGFSIEDITTLVSAVHGGSLQAKLLGALQAENARIAQTLSSPEVEGRLREIESTMRAFYQENGLSFPRDRLANISFAGKFQRLLIQSYRSDMFSPAHIEAGQYYPDVDGIVRNLDSAEEQHFSDAVFSTFIHENFHSLSFVDIQKGAHMRILDPMSIEYMHVGFLTATNGEEELLTLNEGATEFFARLVGKRLGIMPRAGHEYDGYVASLEAVLRETGDAVGTSICDVRTLLQCYGQKSGTDTLSVMFDREIGPYFLLLFDILSIDADAFKKFLQVNTMYKENGEYGEILKIHTDSLENRAIDIRRLKDAYPFLSIGGWVYDYDTDTFPWKETKIEH